jgi:hypothetical protein
MVVSDDVAVDAITKFILYSILHSRNHIHSNIRIIVYSKLGYTILSSDIEYESRTQFIFA